MSDKIELKCFPSDRGEALAMLYLQSQDLTSYSPEDLVDKYSEVLKRIRNRFSENARSR